MQGHPRPPAGWPPQAQPQPLHDPVSPSQYTTLPEVAPNSPDSAPEVLYSSAPETVPPQYHTPYNQHAMSDVSPTVYGQASEDKQLAYPEYPMAHPEYPSTAPSPPGHELLPEMAEKPATMKKKKTIWIIVAIVILLVVIGAAVGGGVGGTAAARRKSAEEASQLSSTSQPSSSTTSQPSSGTTSQSSSSTTSQPISSPTLQPSSNSTSQPNSTSVLPTAAPLPTACADGDACIAGTGEGNFLGLCSFACHYNYTPTPCTCTACGAKVPYPPSTGKKGYPKVDVPDRCSYLGLCSFAWDRGYTDNLAACGSDPAGAVGC